MLETVCEREREERETTEKGLATHDHCCFILNYFKRN